MKSSKCGPSQLAHREQQTKTECPTLHGLFRATEFLPEIDVCHRSHAMALPYSDDIPVSQPRERYGLKPYQRLDISFLHIILGYSIP